MLLAVGYQTLRRTSQGAATHDAKHGTVHIYATTRIFNDSPAGCGVVSFCYTWVCLMPCMRNAWPKPVLVPARLRQQRRRRVCGSLAAAWRHVCTLSGCP
eukprot:365930-Chlamydomonas_euryale.AAC.20